MAHLYVRNYSLFRYNGLDTLTMRSYYYTKYYI